MSRDCIVLQAVRARGHHAAVVSAAQGKSAADGVLLRKCTRLQVLLAAFAYRMHRRHMTRRFMRLQARSAAVVFRRNDI